MSQKNPNPQGKGLVPVLAALNSANTNVCIVPKHAEQLSAELFTSMFVLESRFGFKPIRGQKYWLYRYGKRFQLSLLSPERWSVPTFDQFIGCCELHDDLVWTLDLSSEAGQDADFLAYIKHRHEQFKQTLQASETLADALPVYVAALPFYQRVFASALASSLGKSLQLSGIAQLTYEQALHMAPARLEAGDQLAESTMSLG